MSHGTTAPMTMSSKLQQLRSRSRVPSLISTLLPQEVEACCSGVEDYLS